MNFPAWLNIVTFTSQCSAGCLAFGIIFQHFSIASMRRLSLGEGSQGRDQADTLSLSV